MIYTITNGVITCDIASAGAELMSIRTADGTEYLWQGDKTYWGGRAYNLFPICGRLTEGKYVYEGREYEMNLHGFARKSELAAENIAKDGITFVLKANENTMKMYPFDFEYRIAYALDDNKILINITVDNRGDKTMPFALGGHHGFNVPIAQGAFDDYYLEFGSVCEPKSIVMSETCYTTRKENDFPLIDGRKIALTHSMFDSDAIILKDIDGCVRLASSADGRSVTVRYPSDMKYLGLWHAPKTEAPYISIEPWTSVPAYDGVVDDLMTKRDMIRLGRGGEYGLSWSIQID